MSNAFLMLRQDLMAHICGPAFSGSWGPQAWLTVDPVEGGIAVNIGDMLSRWSAGDPRTARVRAGRTASQASLAQSPPRGCRSN